MGAVASRPRSLTTKDIKHHEGGGFSFTSVDGATIHSALATDPSQLYDICDPANPARRNCVRFEYVEPDGSTAAKELMMYAVDVREVREALIRPNWNLAASPFWIPAWPHDDPIDMRVMRNVEGRWELAGVVTFAHDDWKSHGRDAVNWTKLLDIWRTVPGAFPTIDDVTERV